MRIDHSHFDRVFGQCASNVGDLSLAHQGCGNPASHADNGCMDNFEVNRTGKANRFRQAGFVASPAMVMARLIDGKQDRRADPLAL
jgi:hypothetical protein